MSGSFMRHRVIGFKDRATRFKTSHHRSNMAAASGWSDCCKCLKSNAIIASYEHGALIRTRSPVLTKFPWLSGALRKHLDIRAVVGSRHNFSVRSLCSCPLL